MERFMLYFIFLLLFALTGIAFTGSTSQQASATVPPAQISGY